MGRPLSLSKGLGKVSNRILSYFADIELFLVRIFGFVPIHTVRWLVYLAAGVEIGKNSHIHMGTQFFNPSGVKIGQGSIVGQDVFLDGRDKLVIGDFVDIASEVMIYNSEHDISAEDFVATTGSVEIGDYAFIGPRVIILPGVKIGKGAVIGAGAVVTKDIPEFAIAGGVPAQVIGERKLKDPKYILGRARLFQ